MKLLTGAGRRIGAAVAAAVLASGAFAPGAQAAPKPVVFGTAAASPKTHTGACPTTVTLSTTVKVKAPVALKYVWTFSDGDRTRVKTYRVGGRGLKTVRLSTSVEVTGDARGWGAVRLTSPVKKTSGKAAFAVTCTGDEGITGDTWDSVTTSATGAGVPEDPAAPPPTGQDDNDPARNPVRKVAIAFERTTAVKCPVTFKVHGYFEGLPAGAQTVRYRLVGAQEWKTVNVPADHGDVFSTVLETIDWDWETGKTSVRVEIDQPNRLTSNVIYYFQCGPPRTGTSIGVVAEDIVRTDMGGPLAELIADAYLEAVRTVSGAQVALVSRKSISMPGAELKAGGVTFSQVWGVQSSGVAVDVRSMTGAQLKQLLGHANPQIGALTPSASLRYTVTGGVVTEITLNGAPVSDTQVIKVAATYILMGGWEGFPQWTGTTRVATSGPDNTGALAAYIANHSPVPAPKGDRVTIR
ncbi:5'-nucleotidase C-terminal domain-containing protein [Planobispora longispora]|uniref:5'-nucleotidase C-terminal domain-containing protein n=1 Tax=Planobispora longispora TaxID=28887 RepID=UPI00194549EA|nr:5'-nucleotidase C-terminal domain-containing protein [Planobispora longispora]